jgi:hypothetical protein
MATPWYLRGMAIQHKYVCPPLVGHSSNNRFIQMVKAKSLGMVGHNLGFLLLRVWSHCSISIIRMYRALQVPCSGVLGVLRDKIMMVLVAMTGWREAGMGGMVSRRHWTAWR